VKKSDLIRKIRRAAKKAGKSWGEQLPAGTKHEAWTCGETTVTIPRHREVNEYTAEGIMKDLELELGEEWWRQ
jgi:mRNA interferase HicA